MKPILRTLATTALPAFALAWAVATPAHAQITAVSNLDNADALGSVVVRYEPSFSDLFDSSRGASAAQSFTTGAGAATLAGVTLAMEDTFLVDNGGFTVSLYSDSLGLPGALIAQLSGDSTPNPLPAAEGLFDYTPLVLTGLTEFTPYWIVAEVPQSGPEKQYSWSPTQDLTETGEPGWSMGAFAFQEINSGYPGSWQTSTAALRMEVQIATAEGVPEASTWAAGGAMALLAGATWLRQRRRNRPVA